ncbi:MAG: ATP-binding protein [Chloroflexota bacterium]
MLVFYLLAFLTSSITLLVLRRQGFKERSFLNAIYVLVGLNALGLVLSLAVGPLPPTIVLILQLIAWTVFLWGLSIDGRWLAGFVLLLGLLSFLPGLVGLELLSWGLVTAVPLAAVMLNREQPVIPIFAPPKMTRYRPPKTIIGKISPSALQAQKPILECLASGIIASDVEGNIAYANQAACAIIGSAAANLIGQPITDILIHLPMLASLTSAATKAPNSSFELNGRIIEGRLTIIYDDQGTAQGTVAILLDITSEHYAERSRDTFLTTISHELRTPLTAIKGYVELMGSGVGGDLTPQHQHFVKTIQRNVTRMVQLINSLLFASAVKGGRLEFTSDHTDLPQLLQQISREKTPTAAENGQQIVVQVNGRFPTIQADPMHIATILEELIDNAIKYNKHGGEVRIHAALQTDPTNHAQFAIISISDDGVGIPSEMQAYIFDEFYHPDMNDTQVRAGGMGMGLSVVRSLIDAYNGRIWLESKPHEGSSFFLLLPVKQPEENIRRPTS